MFTFRSDSFYVYFLLRGFVIIKRSVMLRQQIDSLIFSVFGLLFVWPN
jgi:hypothetical protein